MDLLTDILAVYVIATSLVFLLLAAAGVWLWSTAERKYGLLGSHLLSSGDHAEQTGISVVVSGADSPEEISALLSLDYAHYEVIVVCDFGTMAAPADFIRYYALAEVDQLSPGELPYTVPEGVYRSRQRRYHRLLVADKRHTTVSDDLNCGVALSSHKYIVCADRWDKLTPDSLLRLTILLHEHPLDSVYAVGGLERANPHRSCFGLLQALTGMMTLGCGAGAMLGMGYYPGIAVLFERESVVEAEGFDNDFHPCPELLARIRRLPGNRRRRELFTPAIVMDETEEEPTPCGFTPHRIPGGRFGMVSGSAVLLSLLLAVSLLAAAVAAGRAETARTLVAILLTAYLATVTVAAISSVAATRMFPEKRDLLRGTKGKARFLLSLLFYPFSLLRCLTWPKNFIKS